MWYVTALTVYLLGAASASPQYTPGAGDVAGIGVEGLANIHSALAGTQPVCEFNNGWDCVDLTVCVDGKIDSTGAFSLDLRRGAEQAALKAGYTICGRAGGSVQVCCYDEHFVGSSGHSTSGGAGVLGSVHAGGGVGSGVHGSVHAGGGVGSGIHGSVHAGGGVGSGVHGSVHAGGGAGSGVHGSVHSVAGGSVHGVGLGGAGAGYVDQCGVYEECVLKEYCDKGYIVTDGAGLIDLRGKYKYNKCIDPEYPNAEAVCCRVDTSPDVTNTCPQYEACTDYLNCNHEGYVSHGPTYDPRYTSGTECYHQPGLSALTGVCCRSSCPSDSSCIPADLCFGSIQDSSYNWVPYSPNGDWNTCYLVGNTGPGVCCRNPPPPDPLPDKCGLSNYGSQNSLHTRYHPQGQQLTKIQADFGEFPWQAVLFYSNYTFKCGATVVSDRYLLTAAHCVRDGYPEDFRIRLGEYKVNGYEEPYPYQDFEVSGIAFHPKYRRGAEHNNIAIIQLKEPAPLAYNINSICLPDNLYSFPAGTRCIATGWGKDSFTGAYQEILRKVSLPLVEHSYCQELLRKTRLGSRFRLHSGFLCAGGELGIDACTGDGGGPLMCLNEHNQYVLAGITSWGIGCGKQDVPGVYADVAKYIPWILETIQGGGGHPYGK